MSTLRAEELVCRIGRRVILTDIDLTITPGTMTAIIGVNGAGKSTLMRVLAGIRPAASGRVLLDGDDMATLRPRQRARKVAFVAQEETPPDELTLAEMVALGRLPHLMPWQVGGVRERLIVTDCLEQVGLGELAGRRCNQLSGGERRRAMLAKGLAQQTDLLLLDEPTNHLDVHHQLHLLKLIRSSGRTVVATIHDLDLAMGWFDQVVMLADGGIHAAGPASTVMTPTNLEVAFNVRARQIPALDDGVPHLVMDGLVPDETIEGKEDR
ncbi:ABC transporter ATP-binding protein [Arachnia propionica]|uniref:ABC transporter ATP-binding protein n=1 Tax=Arachnia propionica TaxID=1750 RepID=A0A3P1T8T3_9ACTN|nr:ABC transporter ATP-binding protein [Arachnia propionica]MDO5084128.1 ABC transporter ATP-binding protein [Arachnia propionica]RRD05688.1 ABC transporter ATP-binding protein [Arachnia propionica]